MKAITIVDFNAVGGRLEVQYSNGDGMVHSRTYGTKAEIRDLVKNSELTVDLVLLAIGIYMSRNNDASLDNIKAALSGKTITLNFARPSQPLELSV